MTKSESLSGQTAVVTGASSGIGLAISRTLARDGATVYLAGRTQSRIDQAVAELEGEGFKAVGVVLDVRDPAKLQALVDRAVNETGRLDIMVNNAGLSYPGTIADGTPEQWQEMLEVNVLALLVGSQAAIKAMRACGAKGHIVNISSIAGRSEAAGVYGATKAAVNSISRSLRQELEDDSIRVVNICPGAVVTNFGRNFPPEVIQGFLASAGIDEEFKPGSHMPDEAIPKLQAAAKPMFASADDIARAVSFAVTQPIELNIFDMEVRPQKSLKI